MKKPNLTIVGDLKMVVLEEEHYHENIGSHQHIPFALLIECDNADQVRHAIKTGRCEFTVLGSEADEPPAPEQTLEDAVKLYVLGKYMDDGGISLEHQLQRLKECELENTTYARKLVCVYELYKSWRVSSLLEQIDEDIISLTEFVRNVVESETTK